MPHRDTATYMAVNKLHGLAGIETVFLSEIDKEALVALFRLAWTAFRGSSFPLSFILFPLLLFHILNLWCVGIIGKELSELHRDNLLNDVVLVDILEIAADVLHERTYLFLVHIGLHNLVHHLVELLLANLLW